MSAESPACLSLRARGIPARPGEPLPVEVLVDALAGSSIELTLEVERGVLITWNGAVDEAGRVGWQPALVLPLGVPAGSGALRAVLRDAAGAYLGEAEMTLATEEAG